MCIFICSNYNVFISPAGIYIRHVTQIKYFWHFCLKVGKKVTRKKGISTRLPNPILPTFVKNDKISSYYFLFKKKILMMCTYCIETESSNFPRNFNWENHNQMHTDCWIGDADTHYSNNWRTMEKNYK